MGLIATIDVVAAHACWNKICPQAEGLARDAAELALLRGSATSGRRWRGPVELGIILTNAVEQRRLNRDYRGHDMSTNVLAFPAWEPTVQLPAGVPILLGDVVLACETVALEAVEQDKPVADHLMHLVVHGVLHLLGYDHSTQAEAAEMEALETAILASLGVSDPYCDTMSLVKPEPGKS